MKVSLIVATVAAALLAGCASDQAYLKAQADAAVAAGNARVAEAQAAAEEARAVIALSAKIDAGGATAYLVAKAMKGVAAPQVVSAPIRRPRDFLDYLQAFTATVSAVGNIAVPIVSVRENGRTQRELYATNVQIEQARQTGESGRFQSVADIAAQVAAAQPQPNITYTLSGTGVIGNGAYTGPVTRTCNGGTGSGSGPGGPGGGTISGAAGGTSGPGGGAPGGSC